MNKRFMFSFLFASLFLSQASFAGFKEAGGDDSLVFKCTNPSSSVVISGYQSIYETLMEVFVQTDGQLVGEDIGVLSASQYEGDQITLSFVEGKGTVVSSSFKKLRNTTFDCSFASDYQF